MVDGGIIIGTSVKESACLLLDFALLFFRWTHNEKRTRGMIVPHLDVEKSKPSSRQQREFSSDLKAKGIFRPVPFSKNGTLNPE